MVVFRETFDFVSDSVITILGNSIIIECYLFWSYRAMFKDAILLLYTVNVGRLAGLNFRVFAVLKRLPKVLSSIYMSFI